MNHSKWIKRCFDVTYELERDGIQIDPRAWEDNENTTLDLIKWEYDMYEEPTEGGRES